MRSSPCTQTAPWHLPALPIIPLEQVTPQRPVLALVSPDDWVEEEDYGMRKSQLPTLPGPLWPREESPTRPMFASLY